MNRDYSVLKGKNCKEEKPALLPTKDPKFKGEIGDRNLDKRTNLQKEFTEQKEEYDANKAAEQKKDTEVIEEVEEEEEKEIEPEGPIVYPIAPKYKLVHSYPVDIGEFWNDQEIHKVLKNPRPKELVITIQLP